MNVINDSWLFVRYLNNEVKQISVRQAFIDAEKIKNIETPVFHDIKVLIYDVPVIQFLSTLLLAAYFKPETEFKARQSNFNKDLLENGWDINIILNYLDTWQNRFNLEDEKYPFLQNIKLKDITSSDNTLEFLCRTNLVVPGGANLLFEHNPNNSKPELSNYIPTMDELVYMLLYSNSLSTSPMATAYPNKSLCTNQTLFMLAFGKNLKETILYNSLPLRRNSHSENLYDKPCWEFDSYDEIRQYLDEDSLYKNTLLCTFFPSQPMYVLFENNIPVNIQLDKKFISFMSKDEKNELSSQYVISNPWTIAKQNKDTDEYSYKEWTNSLKLIALCIDITKKSKQYTLCRIIENLKENNHARCIIYYREYDGMKANVLSFGKYEISQDIFDKLQVEKNHDKAEIFQTYLSKIQGKFNILKDAELPEFILNNLKLNFSKYSEQQFFNNFVLNIEDADILNNTLDDLILYSKKIVRNSSELSQNPLQYAKSYAKFCGSLNKIRKEYI